MLQDITNLPSRTDVVQNAKNYESCLQGALAELRSAGSIARKGKKGKWPGLSLRKTAAKYGVSKTTLTERYKGRITRAQARQKQQKLNAAEEEVLTGWIKELGYRGVPLTSQLVRQKANIISGKEIGEKWVSRYQARHPELKSRWTTGLEQSRAYSLNRTNVAEFYALLQDIIWKYNIKISNLYNMDEKGVQLGIGGRARVLVDHNQRTAHLVENGNRELVTIIETVCADGTALPPSIIFKGVRRNLEWGRDNPINASISVSPNGWTDQELGCKWMERDFIPYVRNYQEEEEYVLLIMDNHTSHVTYSVCALAEKSNVIILCLPSHCTHRLQPCDVGVFGPLASSWKKEVNNLSRQHQTITKFNFLTHYSAARSRVMKEGTITSSFRKTGIWPFNPNIIEDKAYAPALNTTTQSSLPLPTQVPTIANIVTEPADSESEGSTRTTEDNNILRLQITLPSLLTMESEKYDILQQNIELRKLLEIAEYQMNSDYAQKRLMEDANAELRMQLFGRNAQRLKQTGKGRIGARHMTGDEMLDELAKQDWQKKIDALHHEARERFQKLCNDIVQNERQQLQSRRDAEKEVARQAREAAQLEREAAREQEKVRKQEEREQEKLRKQEEHEQEKQKREAEKARIRLEKEKQKATAKQKKDEDKENKRKQTAGKRKGTRAKAGISQSDPSEETLVISNPKANSAAAKSIRPRAKQVFAEVEERDAGVTNNQVASASDIQVELITNDDDDERLTRARVRTTRAMLRRLPRT